jgi:SAM-dependent methyltransferase
MKHYVIRGGAEGRERLELLGRTLWPTTAELLKRAGLRRGMSCLDLGCGGGDVALEMAAWVEPEGQVVGIDMDGVKIEAARKRAKERGFAHLEFLEADVANWSEQWEYDLVYSRFLLTHLAEPEKVLVKMREAATSDGRMVIEEIDFSGHFCHPPNRYFERYLELYRAVVARRGGDADLGKKIYFLARDAGWQDLELRVVQPAFVEGEGKAISLITLSNIADAVLAEDLASAAELEATVAGMAELTESADSVVSLPRIFQVWGTP